MREAFLRDEAEVLKLRGPPVSHPRVSQRTAVAAEEVVQIVSSGEDHPRAYGFAHADALPGAREGLHEILRPESPTRGAVDPYERRGLGVAFASGLVVQKDDACRDSPVAGGWGREESRLRPLTLGGPSVRHDAPLLAPRSGVVGAEDEVGPALSFVVDVVVLALHITWLFWSTVLRVLFSIVRHVEFPGISEGTIRSWLPLILLRRAKEWLREGARREGLEVTEHIKLLLLAWVDRLLGGFEAVAVKKALLVLFRVVELLRDRALAGRRHGWRDLHRHFGWSCGSELRERRFLVVHGRVHHEHW